MRVVVCGGRDFTDEGHVFRMLDAHAELYGPFTEIIHGNAPGADRLAGAYARRHSIPEAKYPANWLAEGKAAGVKRNQRMLDEGKPDLVFAFPGGRGTADMVRRAQRAGVRVVRA